jgi:diketogulonate reductase-like aldo/keto reductase
MEELWRVPGGDATTTNQVLYNLTRRGPEFDLLPWCRSHGAPIMAYSPIEQARMLSHAGLKKLAAKRGITPAQLALAWLLHQDGVVVIPKAGQIKHVDENAAALDIKLTAEDLAALDREFPPPKRRTPLEML